MNLNFFNTYVAPDASTFVNEALSSTLLSEGKITEQFEQELSNTFGFKNLVTVNSGTSALHLALDLIGLKPGDEVIIPAQTFIATGLAVLYCGATPVFADINYEDGNISVDSVKTKITSKTKAIICVHWGGYPCDLTGLKETIKGTGIKLIEDAAHALGSSYNGQFIGNISDLTCFSFQAIKHLTTGDGGAICVNDPNLYEMAIRKKWFGIDRKHSSMSELGERQYDLKEIGFKYHMNNYAAALGLANLQGYLERLEKRRGIAAFYKSELSGCKELTLFKEDIQHKSAYWLFGFHTLEREKLIKKLKKQNIPSSVVHQRIDRNSIFGGIKKDLVNQANFDKTQLHIPIHDAVSLEIATYITRTIKDVI